MAFPINYGFECKNCSHDIIMNWWISMKKALNWYKNRFINAAEHANELSTIL